MSKQSEIRKKILSQRQIQLAPRTRKPITHDDAPSPYPKSRLMKYIELKFHNKLENLIFKGTIYEAAKKYSISPSVVSKWRKLIRDTEFFGRF